MEEPEDSRFKNDNNKACFNKENILQYLINIFDFRFLSLFKIEKSESDREEGIIQYI